MLVGPLSFCLHNPQKAKVGVQDAFQTDKRGMFSEALTAFLSDDEAGGH